MQDNTERLCIAYNLIYNLKYVPKKIAIIFHNVFNYDYHFVIKELAEEFKKQFDCFGENIEKMHNLYSFDRK